MQDSERKLIREIRDYDIVKMGPVEVFGNTLHDRDDELL